MNTPTPATPQGGWLQRIKTGAAVAFSHPTNDDGNTEDTPEPPRITPRMRELLAELLPYQDPHEYRTPADVATASGIPLGTVQPLLGRLDAAHWTESRLDAHARAYRLTDAGRRGAAAALAEDVDADYTPPARRSPIAVDKATAADEPARATPDEETPAPQQRRADTGEKVWTMAELRAADPELAERVRRRMG